jgi:hypothetical protein
MDFEKRKQHEWKKKIFLCVREKRFNILALCKNYIKKTRDGRILVPYKMLATSTSANL